MPTINQDTLKHPRFGIAILAAGTSSRMGQPKMLLPWAGSTVLGHQVQVWRDLNVLQIAVVHGLETHCLFPELDRLRVAPANRIPNPTPSRGMFSSIQCAARWQGWLPAATHRIVCLGDQPQISSLSLSRLIEAASQFPGHICQPSLNGRPRHPVSFPPNAWKELASVQCNSLRDFLVSQQSPIHLLALDDLGLDADLDSPEDYARALAAFGASSPPGSSADISQRGPAATNCF